MWRFCVLVFCRNSDDFWVCQDGKNLTRNEKEAGKFNEEEAVKLQRQWIHRVLPGGTYSHSEFMQVRQELRELRRKVGLELDEVDDIKVIYSELECG